jgi:hypothetical protein
MFSDNAACPRSEVPDFHHRHGNGDLSVFHAQKIMWGEAIRIDEYPCPSRRMEDGVIGVGQEKFVPSLVFYGIYNSQREP